MLDRKNLFYCFFIYFSYFRCISLLFFSMSDALNDFQQYFNSQNLIFFAMYYEIKKSMDFWVPDHKLDRFKDFCKKYKIFYISDVKFIPIKNVQNLKKQVIWGKNLTSTKYLWEKIESKKKWYIHFLLSMNQEYLDETYKYSWYPIISHGRVLHKNFQDIQDFWESLWYPYCCRKFFCEKNNWVKYSFLYEIYKKSKYFDYRCNSLWKDNPYGEEFSFIYHMPCSFSCKKTIAYVQKIEEKLQETGHSDLREKCQYYLKLPCLIIREQKAYAFEWKVKEKEKEILYKKVFFLGNPKEWDLSVYFKKWNRLQIVNETYIDIYHNAKLIFRYDTSKQEEIEHPFLVQFQ